MKGILKLKTAPATEPVTTPEAKSHLRVDISDDDTLIAGLVTAARRWVENVTGVRLVTQTWYWYFDEFPVKESLEFPIGPVTALASIKYTNEAGTQSPMSIAEYETDFNSQPPNPARVSLVDGKSWPADDLKEINGVELEFTAGYGAASGLVAARASLAAAEVLVAAAVTAGEISAAKAALAAAAAAVTVAEAAEISAIPEEFKLAIKLMVEHWYEHRGSVSELKLEEAPQAVQFLLGNYEMRQRGE